MAVVVDIDLETGDLSEFDSITPPASADIQASANAAMGQTSFGLRITISDATSRYGQAAFTPGATDFRARFYIDPNTLTMASGDNFSACVFTGTDGIIAQAILNWNGANYRLRFRSIEDDESSTSTYVVITDAPHVVEIHVKRGAGTGENKMWIDTVLQATHSNLDNDVKFDGTDKCRFGALYLNATTSGYFYLDELVIRNDDTQIGPNATTTSSTTGGTTTTGASTTTLSGSGSTSTITISATTGTTTTTSTTGTTTSAATTSAAPTTIQLRDGPGGHTARAATGDYLVLRSLDAGGTLRETWVEVLSATNPGAVAYFEYSVKRKSGDAVAHPEGATVVNYGPQGGNVIRLVGEEA